MDLQIPPNTMNLKGNFALPQHENSTTKNFTAFTRRHAVAISLALAVTFGLFVTNNSRGTAFYGDSRLSLLRLGSRCNLEDIHNETLGVSLGLCRGMPSRSSLP